MSSNKLLDLLEVILSPHFDFLPDIIKSPKKDLVHSSIILISDLKTSKYDDEVINKENLKEFFDSSLKIIKNKPRTIYMKLLTEQIFQLPMVQQIEVLNSFKNFNKAKEFTQFLLSNHEKFETHVKKDMLSTLGELGEIKGTDFLVEALNDVSREDESFILQKLIFYSCVFSREQTEQLKRRFQECEGVDLRALYLRLMAQGDLEVSFSLIMSSLQKQADLVVNAAIQSLIFLKKEAQIADSLLDIYANSNCFSLATSVAEVMAGRYKNNKSNDDLQKGLKIVSNLLNHSSFDARIMAVKAAKLFVNDDRMIDWISSLLLSETNEEILTEVLDFLQGNHRDNIKNILMK
ncbi:hypothetical protein MJH12_06265, partial [bacterium]|nr:hypothetical protein [bacterium]